MINIKFAIPASVNNQPGVYNLNAAGRAFTCVATDGPFSIVNAQGDDYDITLAGQGFGDPTSHPFGKLTFCNFTGVVVNVTAYIGPSQLQTTDAAITSNTTVTATLNSVLANLTLAAINQFQKNTAGGGAAVALAAATSYFRKCTIIAQSSLARAVNAGNVYLGYAIGAQPITLAPGDVYNIDGEAGAKKDFQNIFISADNGGDGVSVIYD